MPASGGLAVLVPGQDWDFLIRRADFGPDPAFARLHGKQVRAHDLAQMLPEWASLDWVAVPENLLSKSESSATGAKYRVNVKAHAASSKSRAEVIEAFLRFMTDSPD